MRPEITIILNLAGKLINEIGKTARSNTAANQLPPKVKRKVESYRTLPNVWSWADKDVLALLAIAELIWEEALRPIAGKSHVQLQLHLGVNALSKTATQVALRRAVELKKEMEALRAKNAVLPDLVKVVAARSLLGGPLNASQIALDKAGAMQVGKQAAKNSAAINGILTKLVPILAVTQDTARAHGLSR